jgi:hypothetical protein
MPAKIYTAMPTKQQWKTDLGLSWGPLGNQKSPFPAMERIGKLIDEFGNLARAQGRAMQMMGPFIQFQVLRQADFILKPSNKEKLGGSLSSKQVDCVQGLRNYVYKTLCSDLGLNDANFNNETLLLFGRPVDRHGQEEDANALKSDMMQYYQSDAARAGFKLSFRNGLAYRWDYSGGAKGKGNLVLYDTRLAGDDLEHGASLYVMDVRGRIYVSGKEGEKALKHSSFMGGAATLCAGTMRVDNGKVAWVSGRSGHYRPMVLHMVNLLERLRTYGVNLSTTKVYRENYEEGPYPVPPSPWKFFEGCPATEILVQRAWPTKKHPDSMRVG